jgi:uncharacterized protein (TIRG00374 family)
MAVPSGLRSLGSRLRPNGRVGLVMRVVQVFALVGAVVWLVVPRLGDTADVLGLLGDMAVMPLLVGSLLGLLSVFAYAEVTRLLLPRASRPPRRRAVGVVFSALGVNRIAPLGIAAGSAVTFGLLCREGVSRADAAFAMAVQGIGSAIVLQVLLWSSALAIAPVDGFVPLTLAAVVVGAVVLSVVGVGLWALTRHREATTRRLVGLARRCRKGSERAVPPLVAGVGARLDRLGSDRATVLRSSAWVAANWLADAASLWVFLVAFGADVSPLQALVAFGVANVVATVPVTPGGPGIVETTLALALIALGAPAQAAFLGVAGYRLVHFWLPIPGGLVAFLALRLSRRGTEPSVPLSPTVA